MRLFVGLLLLTSFSTCATFDRLTGREVAPNAAEQVAQDSTVVIIDGAQRAADPGIASPTDTVRILPGDVARTQVQDSLGKERYTAKGGQIGTYENAPETPLAYGTTATTPEPYGSPDPDNYPTTGKGVPTAKANHAVTPNTTITATPETYQHVTAATPIRVNPDIIAALTGLWVNDDDDEEVVEFTSSHYTTFYDGELLVQEPMTLHQRCPGDCNDGVETNISCFTVTGPAGIDCFGIIRLTATELELRLLGVSEETVTYRKRL
ncbi:hypothetical protein [Neolewinella antarctica]|uniref:Lipoprotein n=1 Tax=Neolewinella antarctica TaxID=442734 RepID=A0ABX0X5T0_9BACT|nr:hypothetical protein [Neolewinella antarctica]NJC24563.1 hypothetical protein [Neolewinella antarctica]